MNDVVRIALVGAGRMGSMHLRAMAGVAAVRVTDVVEPHAPRRAELAAQGIRTHTGLDDLLAGERPDGVLVCAPTDRHAEVVRRLVAERLPVLCEKPAGLTWQQVEATGRAAAQAQVLLQVAYWRRFVPDLVRLRDAIAAGELGEILHVVCAQWDGAPPAAGFRSASGGIFVDMGVHEFDQLRWLTGLEIATVHAVTIPALDPAARPDADVGQALLQLAGGPSAVVSLGRHYPAGDVVTVEVFGSRGHASLVVLDPALGEGAMLDALARQAVSFAELLRTGTRHGAGMDDAVAAMQAAEAAAHAATHTG